MFTIEIEDGRETPLKPNNVQFIMLKSGICMKLIKEVENIAKFKTLNIFYFFCIHNVFFVQQVSLKLKYNYFL